MRVRDVRASTWVNVAGKRLETAWVGDSGEDATTIVFLHEGLGCVAMWRDFPARLAERLGARGLVYSRAGYGRSDAVTLPRPLDYMQREAIDVLPALLDALDVERAILFGHSDGGSIAIVAAASPATRDRVLGLVLEAPHLFSEEVSTASIALAKKAYDEGDLRSRLLRYHGENVDTAFRGWNDAWLDPGFASWNIEAYARGVACPTLLVQGADDEYGTLAQLDAFERASRGPVERLVLEGVGHSPHRSAPERVIEATLRFANGLRGSRRSSAP